MRALFKEPDRLRKLQPATAQHSTASSLSLHVPKDQTEERLWAHRRVVLVLRNRLVRLDPANHTQVIMDQQRILRMCRRETIRSRAQSQSIG